MSVAEFSPVLRDAIVKRLQRRFRAMSLDKIKELDTEVIRDITNKKSAGYEAVLRRDNLTELGKQFSNTDKFKNNSEFKKVSKIANSVDDLTSLAQQASDILTSPNLFDNFVSYLSGGRELKFNKSRGKLAYTQISDDIKYGKEDSSSVSARDILIFKENHGDLAVVFRDFLNSPMSGISAPSRTIEFVKEQLDAGHLIGVFNIRFRKFFNLRSSVVSAPSTITNLTNVHANNSKLTEFFQAIDSLLVQADYLSSNSKADPDIFISAEKRVYTDKPQVTVELQLSVLNKEAGNKLAAISRSMNDIIRAVRGEGVKATSRVDRVGAKLAIDKFVKGISKLSESVRQDAERLKKSADISNNPAALREIEATLTNSKTIEKLIGARGSDSFIEAIHNSFLAAITGKPKHATSITTVQSAVKGKGYVATRKVNTTKKSSANMPTRATSVKRIYSNPLPASTNLLAILQAAINQKVAENMGNGSERRILNYRTGRFAESVSIPKISESRQGMISVFYSYMKNPYATFSEGGRQQYPKTRDPKLLISKSIREIAAPIVGNRLRSVVV